MLKCMICERNLGEEAGWDICEDCRKSYDVSFIDMLLNGTAHIIEAGPTKLQVVVLRVPR
jgi:hypothetical protein